MNLKDIETIMAHGTPVQSGYLLRKRDAATAISELKAEIRRIERLKNRAVIADGETIITTYPTTARKQKRMLSGQR
jgi:hypothetical protein